MGLQFVTFILEKEIYAIDIMKVSEVQEVKDIFKIPNLPKTIKGVFELRNNIIPVIDLKKRFKFKEESTNSNNLIIVNVNDMQIGILIDKIKQVIEIDESKIQPPPILNSGINKEYITGVYKMEDEENKLIIIIDIDKLFSQEELYKLKEIKNR